MRRSLILGFACVAAMLLATGAASAAGYNTFVSCDEPAENPSPSYFCEVGEAPRAFFEVSEETAYEFCVEYPTEKTDCRKPKIVKPGILATSTRSPRTRWDFTPRIGSSGRRTSGRSCSG